MVLRKGRDLADHALRARNPEVRDVGRLEGRLDAVLVVAHSAIHSLDSVTDSSSSGIGERPRPGSRGTSR